MRFMLGMFLLLASFVASAGDVLINLKYGNSELGGYPPEPYDGDEYTSESESDFFMSLGAGYEFDNGLTLKLAAESNGSWLLFDELDNKRYNLDATTLSLGYPLKHGHWALTPEIGISHWSAKVTTEEEPLWDDDSVRYRYDGTDLSAGISIGYWFGRHFGLSASARYLHLGGDLKDLQTTGIGLDFRF